MTILDTFVSDDAGAVTIDWVALTAGVLLLGIVVVYAIFNNGVSDLVNRVNSGLSKVNPAANVGLVPDCSVVENC